MAEITPQLPPGPDSATPDRKKQLSPRKLWIFRLIAVAMVLGFSFLILELAVRVLVQQPFGTIEDLRRFEEHKQTGKRLTLINFVRPSTNRGLVYEMIPGVEGEFWGAPVRINRAGQHDRERTVEKPAGTYRIATLGDSVLFGWGVPQEARFSSLLEMFLNESATTGAAESAPRFEVLNFGVPGYNTRMEAEVLKSQAMKYQPDALLVAFVPDNDARLPNFVVKPRNPLNTRRSYLLDVIRSRGLQVIREGMQPGLQAADQEDVPEEYRFLAGESAMEEGFKIISRTAAESSLPLLLMPYFFNVDQLDTQGQVVSRPREAAEAAGKRSVEEFAARAFGLVNSLGYRVVDPRPGVGLYLGARNQTWEDLMLDLARKDTHPNLVYHALLAKELYRALVEEGTLPDAEDRRTRLAEDLQRWDQIVDRARVQLAARQSRGAAQ